MGIPVEKEVGVLKQESHQGSIYQLPRWGFIQGSGMLVDLGPLSGQESDYSIRALGMLPLSGSAAFSHFGSSFAGGGKGLPTWHPHPAGLS